MNDFLLLLPPLIGALGMIEENDRTSLQEIVDTVRKRVEANHE